MQITWNKNIEPNNKAEIEKYLNPYLWLIPQWCQRVIVNLEPSDGSGAISNLVEYDYRKVTLDFYSGWLIQTDEKKQQDIVHECIHIFVNELYHQARRIVIASCDEPMKDFAFKELAKTTEGVTQDLAFAIYNKFNGESNQNSNQR